MVDKMDGTQLLSTLFTDEVEADNYLLFAEQSMVASPSLVVAEREQTQQMIRDTNNGLQSSKSICTLFGRMAWNGSCTSFMGGGGEELLHFSSSTDDFESTNDVLGLTKKKRCSRSYLPSYKHGTTSLKAKLSTIKNSCDKKSARNIRLQQSPYMLFFGNDPKDTGAGRDANISLSDVLNVDSKKMIKSKFEDLVESTLPESKRKPKRGLSRKDSCLIESGRNKLPKTMNSSHHLLCNPKDDIAPRCPRRCESPTEVNRSQQLRVEDDKICL